MNNLSPLSLRETELKEEMKSRCLNKGQYIDENAKEKFEMLCHLEDFEVGYWELKSVLEEIKEYLDIDRFVSFMPHTKRYTHLMKIRCDLMQIMNKGAND